MSLEVEAVPGVRYYGLFRIPQKSAQ